MKPKAATINGVNLSRLFALSDNDLIARVQVAEGEESQASEDAVLHEVGARLFVGQPGKSHFETAMWEDALAFFTSIAEDDSIKTIEHCMRAPIAQKLRCKESAAALAIIAWRRTENRPIVAGSVWSKLHGKPAAERERLLSFLAYDGAVSCAYEGIDIKPTQLKFGLE